MKIMYVDISIYGHHLIYLNGLLQAVSSESFSVLPEHEGQVIGRCRNISAPAIRTFSGYRKWMKELKKIAAEEHPDIIHFLDGDTIMRYFGWGLSGFAPSKVVITFHHFFQGKLREISIRRMLKQAAVGVFHTEQIVNKVKAFGCHNIKCVPYPCFLKTSMLKSIGYQNDPPVLLALGGTRYEKGLDILLQALKSVKSPFRLLIAGGVTDFDEEYVKKAVQSYRSCVEWDLRVLTEEEVLAYLQRADIIVLPYRRLFDGASGPMCEGVYLGKTILGPNHGSLGELIRKYHIGYTFESENIADLCRCLDAALCSPFVYDEIAIEYQKSLQPEIFKKSYVEIYQQIAGKSIQRDCIV